MVGANQGAQPGENSPTSAFIDLSNVNEELSDYGDDCDIPDEMDACEEVEPKENEKERDFKK